MEVIAQEHVIAQKHEFLPAWQISLDSAPTMGSSAGIALAILDTQPFIQNIFKLLISHQYFKISSTFLHLHKKHSSQQDWHQPRSHLIS